MTYRQAEKPIYKYGEALKCILNATTAMELKVLADIINEDKYNYTLQQLDSLLVAYKFMCFRIIENKEFE